MGALIGAAPGAGPGVGPGGRVVRRLFRAIAAGGFVLAAAAPVAAAEVTVYSARHYRGDQAVFDLFTKDTGIKVTVVQGDANGLIQRLQREGQNSPADLMVTVDAGNLWRLHSAGLTQPVKSTVLEENVPAALREPNGHWFAISQRARILAYHTDRVKAADLSTYEALADPKWKGKLLVRSSNVIYNQSLIAAMIAANGADRTETWAKGLVANLARVPQGGDADQLTALAAGQGDVAIVNSYYLAQLKDGTPQERASVEKIIPFFPNQGDRGTHVNVSGVALAKYAPERDAAIKLMEFLVKPESQRLIAEGNYEYPVLPEVAMAPVLSAWGKFKSDGLNLAVLGQNNAEAVRLADRAGWR
jgi:iron(III) transport system substrate-binding protein